jgi:hypothetical protein
MCKPPRDLTLHIKTRKGTFFWAGKVRFCVFVLGKNRLWTHSNQKHHDGCVTQKFTTASSKIGFRIFLGYPFVSQNRCRYLDIRLCSIPTVGVYEKQGKLHLTRSTSYLLYIIHLRSMLPPAIPPPPRWTPLQLVVLPQPAAQLGEGL